MMSRFFLRSRSASVSGASPLRKFSEANIQADYDRRTRRHWKEIFASFVLLSCFVMVAFFIMELNVKMSSGSKPFKGSRQRGPFGLPETTTLRSAESEEEGTDGEEMPTIREDIQTVDPNGELGTHRDQEEPPPPIHPDLKEPEPRTEDPEYEDKKVRAPSLQQSGEKGAKCSTPVCRSLTQWFQRTVGRQADPCRERNTFVCDPAAPFPGFMSPLAKRLERSKSSHAHGASISQQGGFNYAERADLLKSCLRYALEPNTSIDDVLLFLSHFNLDLRRMVDDPAEDPLARMMELSLDYGVDTPVSFVRQYDVTGEASGPYVVKVSLNPEVTEFFNSFLSLEEEEILTFYQFCLKTYAHLKDYSMAEQLVNADNELSDFLNKTVASDQPSRIGISKLAEATGVSAVQIGGSNSLYRSAGLLKLYDGVIADEQALSFVAYLSRPLERLAMRRLLAWHVLRYMISPLVDIGMAANTTHREELSSRYLFQPRYPKTKCMTMVAKLQGVKYAALSLWEGNGAVSTNTIVEVTRFMGEFQDAMASVFRSAAANRSDSSENDNATASGQAVSKAPQVALFSTTAGRDGDSVSLFEALDGGNESVWEDPAASTRSFLRRWLRHLRAWHALPPLVQALLPRMASVANVDKPGAFFRPPYYDARAPLEYNFATLGQVISKAMAHELAERRRIDPAIGKHWRGYWEGMPANDGNSVYCLRVGLAENDTWREKRLDEDTLADRTILYGVLGSRIAYLTYQRTQQQNATSTGLTERLPGIDLSSKQLFFVMHCAISCVMGPGPDPVAGRADNRCMVAYKPGRRSIIRPCRQMAGGSAPNECHYI